MCRRCIAMHAVPRSCVHARQAMHRSTHRTKQQETESGKLRSSGSILTAKCQTPKARVLTACAIRARTADDLERYCRSCEWWRHPWTRISKRLTQSSTAGDLLRCRSAMLQLISPPQRPGIMLGTYLHRLPCSERRPTCVIAWCRLQVSQGNELGTSPQDCSGCEARCSLQRSCNNLRRSRCRIAQRCAACLALSMCVACIQVLACLWQRGHKPALPYACRCAHYDCRPQFC